MRLPAILLIALLPVCGCEIFLDDWGAEGAPCGGENDCQQGLVCEGHECRKGPEQSFGLKCDPGNPGLVCGGEFGECACFSDHNCYCTHPCNNAHECDDIPTGAGGARCTLLDPFGLQGYCANWQWSNSYGNLCIPGEFECDNGLCASFQVDGLHVCTTPCQPMCPEGLDCRQVVEPQQEVCGLPFWFGFWHGCGSNTDCDTQFPQFPICKNDQNCTKSCASNVDCPPGTHCDNPGDGDCVPDM